MYLKTHNINNHLDNHLILSFVFKCKDSYSGTFYSLKSLCQFSGWLCNSNLVCHFCTDISTYFLPVLFTRSLLAWTSLMKQPSGQLKEHVCSALTGLPSMPALCWVTLCRRVGQRLNFTKPSVSWRHTWAWQESVSEAASLSSFPGTKAEGLWLMCVGVPQCCVWETPWRHWRLPRGPFTFLTACWGSAWPLATSTEPCTLPVTTSCGQEKQASSPCWTNTNGVRDLSGEPITFFSLLCVRFNDKCICSTSNQ